MGVAKVWHKSRNNWEHTICNVIEATKLLSILSFQGNSEATNKKMLNEIKIYPHTWVTIPSLQKLYGIVGDALERSANI